MEDIFIGTCERCFLLLCDSQARAAFYTRKGAFMRSNWVASGEQTAKDARALSYSSVLRRWRICSVIKTVSEEGAKMSAVLSLSAIGIFITDGC